MIVKATKEDLEPILRIYAHARRFMQEHGNPRQWRQDYPAKELVLTDIQNGNCYVYMENGTILGVFSFFLHADPSYACIYNGNWLNEEPYGVVHRLAVCTHGQGIAGFCLDYALSQCPNLRIDTHRDNLPMQRLLAKQGFVRCGIIFLANGEERLAYQKTV